MITFLTGDNDYAIKAEIDHLKDEFIKMHGSDGLEQYAAKELELNKLPDLISGGSLFSALRLVIVRDIGENKELAEAIAERAKDVDDSTTLVLSQVLPDKRTRWYNALKTQAKTLAQLRGSGLVRWLVDEANNRKSDLMLADARYLITLVGEDQWRLSSELDKLLNSGQTIDQKLIDKLVEPSQEETIFQLTDLVVKGQVEPALALYRRLRLSEIDPHQFIGTLSWQLNALLVVKTNQGQSSSALASKSGLSPFVIDRLKPLARRLTAKQLKESMRLALEADFEMKQTGSDPDQRAKLLIGQLGQVIS